MKFLLLFIFVVFGFGMLFLNLLKGIGRMMFGKQAFANGARTNNYKSDSSDEGQARTTTKKIFDKNEGEYVSYEEIKD